MARAGNIILAAYGTPGVLAAGALLRLGYQPEQLKFLTYPSDTRNESLRVFAFDNDIETVEYEATSPEALAWFESLKPLALFSLHYRHKIPGALLKILTYGGINLHPSLLPKYRGTFSIPWALINQEKETGFTYHFMDENFDTGNILLQRKVPIASNATAFTLFHQMIMQSLAAFGEVHDLLIEKNNKGTPQVGKGSYYSRELPYNGIIDPSWTDSQIDHFIRAMYFPPFKGAIATIDGVEHEVNSLAEYKELMQNND